MKIRPLYDRIVVKRIEEQETTRSGIIIPDSAQEKPQEAEVMAVGHGKRLEDGKLVPLDVKVGDRILFGKYSGNDIRVDGQEYLIMREDDVLGVLDAAPKTVLLQIRFVRAKGPRTSGALLGDTKDAVNESDLPDHSSFCQPADLPFANDVHRLVSGDRVQRAVGRSKPQTGGDSFLDESVVLFHDVVQVRRWPAAALFSEFA